jgi:hypothetical protein
MWQEAVLAQMMGNTEKYAGEGGVETDMAVEGNCPYEL